MNFLLEATLSSEWQTLAWAIAAAVVGYTLFFFTNPLYQIFRDGLRCLNRYPRLWLWLSILGLNYTLFQRVLEYKLGEFSLSLNDLIYWPQFKPIDWSMAAGRAWLATIELLAGLFNQAAVAYPVSAVAALLFLINWRSYQGYFLAASKQRLGRWWLPVYVGLLICALAAFCKPIFSVSIDWLNQYWGEILLLRIGAVIDWLSFQFECLFGLLIQIFLVLSTFVWVRGLNADPARIFRLALKRSVYVVKWAGIVLGTTSILIYLPLLASYLWIAQQTDFTNAVVQYVNETARPLLAISLILFCSVQLTLILHNETLQEAVSEHARLVRCHWYHLLWFFLVVGFHLFAICWLSEYLSGGFPKYSVPALLMGILFTLIKGFLSGWFISSWVSLYRNSQAGRKEVRF